MKLQQIIIRVNFKLNYLLLPIELKHEKKFYYQNSIILKINIIESKNFK